MVALYHQAKTPIDFWCRRDLTLLSLEQKISHSKFRNPIKYYFSSLSPKMMEVFFWGGCLVEEAGCWRSTLSHELVIVHLFDYLIILKAKGVHIILYFRGLCRSQKGHLWLCPFICQVWWNIPKSYHIYDILRENGLSSFL